MIDAVTEGDRLAEQLAADLDTPVLRSFTAEHRVDIARWAQLGELIGDEAQAWSMLSSGEQALLHAAWHLQALARCTLDLDADLTLAVAARTAELGSAILLPDHPRADVENQRRDELDDEAASW